MSGFVDIKDFRFEGYDNPSLAQLVQRFDGSDAAKKFGEASHALRTLATSLIEVDKTLRDELGKLGIAWQGNAGDNAGKSVTVSADYADETQASSKQNAQATMMQSDSHSAAKNGMPPSQALQGASETTTVDDFADFFGVETDHAAEVKETNAARQQTIDGLNGYTQNSRDAISSFETPGKPPTFDVTAASSATSISSATVTMPGGVQVPGGSSSLPGGTSTGLPGGGGGFSGVNLPGGGNGNGIGGGNLPGGGNNTGLPLPPGNSTGVNPLSPNTSALPPAASALPKGGGSNLPLGLGLAGAGALGLGAAAATARGARIVRGGAGGGAAAVGGGATPAGKAPAATGPGTGPAGKAGAAVTGVVGEENAPRTGPGAKGGAGRGGAPASGMMQPAASGRGAPGEEDDEHVRKYGVESDEVFGDERLVVQSVIGDEDGPRQKDDPVR
jgi:hypothetical protein